MATNRAFEAACIFCGGGPPSKEHVYPAWMRDFLVKGYGIGHWRAKSKQELPSGLTATLEEKSAGPETAKGDARGRYLRVVCATCNHTWMNAIQNESIPELKPFLEGKLYVPTRSQQKRIAAWAVMFTMVHEFVNRAAVAVVQDDRNQFMLTHKPSKNWMVWIGSFRGFFKLGTAFHRGMGIGLSKLIDDGGQPKCNTQVTLGAAGAFCFLTFYSADDSLINAQGKKLRLLCQGLGLRRVWPPTSFHQRGDILVEDYTFDHLMDLFSDSIYVR